jgi:hypothetical protein
MHGCARRFDQLRNDVTQPTTGGRTDDNHEQMGCIASRTDSTTASQRSDDGDGRAKRNLPARAASVGCDMVRDLADQTRGVGQRFQSGVGSVHSFSLLLKREFSVVVKGPGFDAATSA